MYTGGVKKIMGKREKKATRRKYFSFASLWLSLKQVADKNDLLGSLYEKIGQEL